MTGKTHMAGGVCLALALTEATGIYHTDGSLITLGVICASAGFGALMPDIDTKQSKISREHKVTSFFTRLFFTHRGFTHSLLALGILGAVLFCVSRFTTGIPYVIPAVIGILIGYGSHLLLDMLNPMGIPLLYPLKTRVSVCKIKTGGVIEYLVLAGLIAGIGWMGYTMYF